MRTAGNTSQHPILPSAGNAMRLVNGWHAAPHEPIRDFVVAGVIDVGSGLPCAPRGVPSPHERMQEEKRHEKSIRNEMVQGDDVDIPNFPEGKRTPHPVLRKRVRTAEPLVRLQARRMPK